jgi:5-methylcytosine-specific restriction protein A
MPLSTARPCPGKGPRSHSCPNYIRGNVSYCPECQVYADKDKRGRDRERDKDDERKFLHSVAWRREREHYLNLHPLCERCLIEGRETPATLVHHKDGNELNRDDANKEALCNNCHEKIHGPSRWRKKPSLGTLI